MGSSRSPPEDGKKEQQVGDGTTGVRLDEKIEHARRLLEERRQEKAIKAIQEVHEAELKRRDLGRNLAEFKVVTAAIMFVCIKNLLPMLPCCSD